MVHPKPILAVFLLPEGSEGKKRKLKIRNFKRNEVKKRTKAS
jgi:hypothetical protein